MHTHLLPAGYSTLMDRVGLCFSSLVLLISGVAQPLKRSLKKWGILPFFVSPSKTGLRYHFALCKWRLVESNFNDSSGVSKEAEIP
jgi:hypothetical protein